MCSSCWLQLHVFSYYEFWYHVAICQIAKITVTWWPNIRKLQNLYNNSNFDVVRPHLSTKLDIMHISYIQKFAELPLVVNVIDYFINQVLICCLHKNLFKHVYLYLVFLNVWVVFVHTKDINYIHECKMSASRLLTIST